MQLWARLPFVDVARYLFNSFSFLLQLVGHVLQIVSVVLVRILQKLITGNRKTGFSISIFFQVCSPERTLSQLFLQLKRS